LGSGESIAFNDDDGNLRNPKRGEQTDNEIEKFDSV